MRAAAWLAIALLASSSLAAQDATPFSQALCVDRLTKAAAPETLPAEEGAETAVIEETQTVAEAALEAEAKNVAMTDDRNACALGGGQHCGFPTTEMAVLAGDADGRAFLRYAAEASSISEKLTWSLETTVPISKKDKEGVFASLDGVSGDVTVAAQGRIVSWGTFEYSRYIARLCQVCADERVALLADCFPEAVPDLLKKRGVSERRAERQAQDIVDAGFGWLVGSAWGGKVAAGRAERQFFAADGSVDKEDRVGFTVGATGLLYLRNGSLAFDVLQKRDYEEAKPATVCKPVATGSPLEECQTKPRSRAEVNDGLVTAVEWKVALLRLAVVPKLMHDFDQSRWEAQLPIYLVRNKDDQLTGGVRIGWRSDTDDVSAAIFVAQPLKF